jgi:hypothetical protein
VTFCDSLLFADAILESLDGLIERATLAPFSLEDFSRQFGPAAAGTCATLLQSEVPRLTREVLRRYTESRNVVKPTGSSLLNEEIIVARARQMLVDGRSPALAMEALFQDLGAAVGAEDPAGYQLTAPFTREQIEANPYWRLRVGLTYRDLVSLFERYLTPRLSDLRAPQLVVSDLLDSFVDRGAVVPTISSVDDSMVRVYRKGESNPRWSEDIDRVRLGLRSLRSEDRALLRKRGGRTRVSKVCAILAYSGEVVTSLQVGSLERGTVAMLAESVVEREGGEITRLMRDFGFLDEALNDGAV